MRQWGWNKCTGWGQFKTVNAQTVQLFGNLSLKFYLQNCEDAFLVNPSVLAERVAATNTHFGGRLVAVRNRSKQLCIPHVISAVHP